MLIACVGEEFITGIESIDTFASIGIGPPLILVKQEMIKKGWREYMEQQLNVENDWDGIVECGLVQRLRELIIKMEVEKAIGQIKNRKEDGLMELVGEIICAAGQVGVKMMEICNMVVDDEKILRDWELSTFLPIYKGRGDPLECGAHTAIKLLQHGMKVFERESKY